MGKKEDGLPRCARNDESAAVTVDPAAGGDATAGEQIPLPIPEGGWPADEFTGHGGSFVRDPFTGLRSKAEQAQE